MTAIERLAEQLPTLLDHLREDAGFTVGVDQYLAVDRLLLALASGGPFPADATRLKTLLGPVVCKSEKEQALFSSLFDDWLNRLEPTYVAARHGTLARELGQFSSMRRLGLRILLAVAVAGMFLAAAGLYSRREQRKVEERNQISIEPEPRLVSGPDAPDRVSQTVPRTTWPLAPTSVIIEGLLVLCAGLIGWRLWWAYRVRRFLAKRPTRSLPDFEHIAVAGVRGMLFSRNSLLRLAQRMRAPTSVGSDDLDVRATVLATARRGGVFTPVQAHVQVSPEYLVLVDKTGFQDHQARLFEELIAGLTRHEIICDRYDFDVDPNVCHSDRPHGRLATLRDLAARHSAHRLLIFSVGDGLLDPLSGEPAAWVDLFARWPDRALLTPVGFSEWGYRELVLARHGFLVVPASDAGLSALVDSFNADPSSPGFHTPRSAPIPDLVEDRPQRWLERHEPETQVLTELLDGLKRYLGAEGYAWLAACAFYPALIWDLTLYLGHTLERSSRRRMFDWALLLSLARLPWFRHGSMPNWLRTALIESLTPVQAAAIRESLQLLLISAVQGDCQEFSLEVARANHGILAPLARSLVRHLRANAPEDSPLRDHVFAMGLLGRGPRRLVVEVPRVVSARVSVTPRRLLGAALGALAIPTELGMDTLLRRKSRATNVQGTETSIGGRRATATNSIWRKPATGAGAILLVLAVAWGAWIIKVKPKNGVLVLEKKPKNGVLVLENKPKNGVLVLENLPANCVVEIDGEKNIVTGGGGEPVRIEARAGEHVVSVKLGDKMLLGERVTLEPGKPSTVRMRLVPTNDGALVPGNVSSGAAGAPDGEKLPASSRGGEVFNTELLPGVRGVLVKQTIDAKGMKFETPKSWKSNPPRSQMRRAQLTVDPIEGDDYPAELIVFAFPGGAGTVEANIKRWQNLFKDKEGNPPAIERKIVKGKNIEVTRVETSGDYHPAQFPGARPEPERPGARLLGAIVMTEDVGYYVRMVGPNKTMIKLRPDFDALLSSIEIEGK
jgi:hypothetical protein